MARTLGQGAGSLKCRTAPADRRSVRFVWSGDTAGQGWGIDEAGMTTYRTMAGHEPDFFLHSGDTVYADGPMEDTVELADGGTWTNVVLIPEKRKVAETLEPGDLEGHRLGHADWACRGRRRHPLRGDLER